MITYIELNNCKPNDKKNLKLVWILQSKLKLFLEIGIVCLISKRQVISESTHSIADKLKILGTWGMADK